MVLTPPADLQMFASDPIRTVIALDDSSDESSFSSDFDDSPLYGNKERKDVAGSPSGPVGLSQVRS